VTTVLEVCAREPQLGAAVDDVGRAPGERQRQLFVDLDVDRHVVGQADSGRELLGEPRDHACVVLDERELLGRDLDARHR